MGQQHGACRGVGFCGCQPKCHLLGWQSQAVSLPDQPRGVTAPSHRPRFSLGLFPGLGRVPWCGEGALGACPLGLPLSPGQHSLELWRGPHQIFPGPLLYLPLYHLPIITCLAIINPHIITASPSPPTAEDTEARGS